MEMIYNIRSSVGWNDLKRHSFVECRRYGVFTVTIERIKGIRKTK